MNDETRKYLKSLYKLCLAALTYENEEENYKTVPSVPHQIRMTKAYEKYSKLLEKIQKEHDPSEDFNKIMALGIHFMKYALHETEYAMPEPMIEDNFLMKPNTIEPMKRRKKNEIRDDD